MNFIPYLQTVGAAAPPAWANDWRSAFTAAESGLGQAHVAVFGDSVAAGYYSTPDYYVNSWAGALGSAVATATGQPAGTGVVYVEDEFAFSDARAVFAGTWADSTASGFYRHCRIGDAATDTLTIGPITCSSFRILAVTDPTLGSYEYQVDGGGWTTVPTTAATGLLWTDIPAGAEAPHTLVVRQFSGVIALAAWEARRNLTTGVRVSRVALSGAEASLFLYNAFPSSSRGCYLSMTPDLSLVCFGLNEALLAVPVATFSANLATIITDLRSVGSSVLIVADPPPNPAYISAATWLQYRQAMQTTAAANGAGFYDMTTPWVSYATSIAYYFDNVHPNNAGHANMGSVLASYILAVV